MRPAGWTTRSGFVPLLLLVGGCAPGSSETETIEARTRAERAADALAGSLITRLTSALQDEGAVPALTVCSEVAQKMTRDLGQEHGLAIRRTSLRTRNPLNEPDDYELAWLERAAQRAAAEAGVPPAATAEVIETEAGGRALRYVRPLFLAELCVQCHGSVEQLADGIPEALARLYPEDRATGFAPGDLRGAISVRVPLDD